MDESTPLLPPAASSASAAAASRKVDDDPDALPRHAVAAWIVDETMRGAPVARSGTLPRTKANRAAYLFFENGAALRRCAVLLLLMLSFAELPSWCSGARECKSPDGSSLFLSGVPYLSPGYAAAANAVLLAVLVFYAAYDGFCLPGAGLHVHEGTLQGLLALLVVDFGWTLWYGGYPPVRVAPFLRVMLAPFYWDALRECSLAIAAITSPFLDVAAVVALFGFLFGWVRSSLFFTLSFLLSG